MVVHVSHNRCGPMVHRMCAVVQPSTTLNNTTMEPPCYPMYLLCHLEAQGAGRSAIRKIRTVWLHNRSAPSPHPSQRLALIPTQHMAPDPSQASARRPRSGIPIRRPHLHWTSAAMRRKRSRWTMAWR